VSVSHIACRALIATILLAGCDRRTIPTTDRESDRDQATRNNDAIPTAGPLIRVRLHRLTGGNPSITIGQAKQAMAIRVGDTEVQLEGPSTIGRKQGRWTASGVNLPTSIASADVVELTSPTPLSVGSHPKRTYEGIIRCVADQDPPRLSFSVINVVKMEQYIPGVLAGELYEGWHDAAFKAQAVAARSFALSRHQQRKSHTWDVTDTSSSQVYVGIPSWNQATRTATATSGEIITWRGEVVPGYFSSCCGGRAALASQAIGPNPINKVPPLDGHSNPAWCTEAPRYRWTGPWDPSKVSRAIRSWARRVGREDLAAIGEVVSIKPMSPNRHGRPSKVEIRGSGGKTATIRCVDLPGVFAESDLNPLSSGWIDAEVKRGFLVVNGHGFGHGAGLCQYGAEAMAASALTYERIIQFYYPQGELTKAW
jgi:stage II sporulation protein D